MKTIHSLIALLSMTIFTFGAPAFAQPAPSKGPLIVGFIGDSITAGFGALHGSAHGKGGGQYEGMATDAVAAVWRALPGFRGPMADISPFGIPGTTAQSWLQGYYGHAKDDPGGWKEAPPDLFMVMFGGNEANEGENVDAYLANLKALVDRVHADFPRAKIVVNATLPINQAMASAHMGFRPGTAALVEQYVKALKAKPSFIDEKTVILGDTEAHDRFLELDKANPEGPQSPLPDGTHPSDASYKILGEYWIATIKRVLAE